MNTEQCVDLAIWLCRVSCRIVKWIDENENETFGKLCLVCEMRSGFDISRYLSVRCEYSVFLASHSAFCVNCVLGYIFILTYWTVSLNGTAPRVRVQTDADANGCTLFQELKQRTPNGERRASIENVILVVIKGQPEVRCALLNTFIRH